MNGSRLCLLSSKYLQVPYIFRTRKSSFCFLHKPRQRISNMLKTGECFYFYLFLLQGHWVEIRGHVWNYVSEGTFHKTRRIHNSKSFESFVSNSWQFHTKSSSAYFATELLKVRHESGCWKQSYQLAEFCDMSCSSQERNGVSEMNKDKQVFLHWCLCALCCAILSLQVLYKWPPSDLNYELASKNVTHPPNLQMVLTVWTLIPGLWMATW